MAPPAMAAMAITPTTTPTAIPTLFGPLSDGVLAFEVADAVTTTVSSGRVAEECALEEELDVEFGAV